MSTANKLDYISETKNRIKTVANYAEAGISADTFRSYPEKIYNSYIDIINGDVDIKTDMPKLVSSGTNIDLTNAIDKPFADFSLYGETQQDSTKGYQLLKNTNVNSGDNNYWVQYSTFDATTRTLTRSNSTTSEKFIWHKIDGLKSNQQYTLSCYIKSNGYVASAEAFCYNENTQGVKTTQISSAYLTTSFKKFTWTFTTASDVSYSSGAIIRFDNNSTTQSGTDAILTVKDVMLEEGSVAHDYEDFTNGPAPNPSYPQPIHNVSGDNTIEICGKNLLDTSKLTMFSSNKYVATIDYTTKGAITIDSNTTYSVILNKSLLSDRKFYEYDSANTRTQITTTNTDIGDYRISTFTTSANAKTFGFYAGGSDSYTDLDTLLSTTKIMLLKGSYTTIPTYEAYTGNSQLISLGVENIFEITQNKKNVTSQYQGVVYGNFSLVNGETYTLSVDTNNNDGYIYINENYFNHPTSATLKCDGKRHTYTCTAKVTGTYSDSVLIKTSANVATAYDLNNIQLEKGSKANSYSEYGKPYIELNKISTYQDYIYKESDRWYLHKEIGKVVLDGTQSTSNMTLNTSSTNTTRVLFNNVLDSNSIQGYGLCERLKYQNIWNFDNEGVYFDNNSTAVIFRMNKTTIGTSKSEVNTYFTNNNTAFYYVLATPTDTEITDTTLLEQLNNLMTLPLYKNLTHITLTPNDLQPTMKIETIKDYNTLWSN